MSNQDIVKVDRFIPFEASVQSFTLPKRFTYPFYYTPDPLIMLAAKELQNYLLQRTDWEHNFGVLPEKVGEVTGKMFGVLVVENSENELGFLAAFSGKLNGKNDTSLFVPPVHNMPEQDGFIDFGMVELGDISEQIKDAEQRFENLQCKRLYESNTVLAAKQIEAKREENRIAKQARKAKREEGRNALNDEQFELLNADLSKESQRRKSEFKAFRKSWEKKLLENKKALDFYTDQIDRLKAHRKKRSGELQQQLFDQYHFLNQAGKRKSVREIFEQTPHKVPPSAAGECAAPKLLQYAFKHQLKPIAIGEFWWGQSPKSELRKHGFFYPACRGKCEPILSHMLEGIALDKNPLLNNLAVGKELEIVLEDDEILVINKPFGLLSVPGKTIEDSVLTRVKEQYPDATGSLIVHRLDMATSGLMVLAKTKEAHKIIHKQFEDRTIKKRYVALLEGVVDGNQGIIDLPLRVDLDDRPRQLVCYEYGKRSQTKWEVVERIGKRTKVHFYPITGRSHQLRVHSAHPSGLDVSIVGDELYGTKANRLHLHAEAIAFVHPKTGEVVQVEVQAEF